MDTVKREIHIDISKFKYTPMDGALVNNTHRLSNLLGDKTIHSLLLW